MNYRPVIIIIDTAIINENSKPISCTDFQKQPVLLMFFTIRATRHIKEIILDRYIPLSAYVKVDSSVVVSERICAINAA